MAAWSGEAVVDAELADVRQDFRSVSKAGAQKRLTGRVDTSAVMPRGWLCRVEVQRDAFLLLSVI
jgi:hypothetical protein